MLHQPTSHGVVVSMAGFHLADPGFESRWGVVTVRPTGGNPDSGGSGGDFCQFFQQDQTSKRNIFLSFTTLKGRVHNYRTGWAFS